MATNIVLNGVVYAIPDVGEETWGTSLSDFFIAIPQGVLQKSGGTFTLTANANFGANFGLLAAYFSTRGALPSTAGLIRLNLSDTIGWRNNANDGNLLLAVNGSNALTFNGSVLQVVATMPAHTFKGNNTGGASNPLDLTIAEMIAELGSTAATASLLVARDVNANARVNNLIENFATTVTAAGTTTLVVGSPRTQQFTGSTTQTVVLPDATTLVVGQQFVILNRSSGVVTVNANGGGLVQAVAASSQSIVTVTNIGSAAGVWDSNYSAPAGTGTVTSVAMTVPTALFAASPVSGSPVTITGTLAPVLATQTANTLFAGPTSGSAATPTFRAQVAADRPLSVVSKTTTYGVAATDDVILCSGSAFTVTLPAANALSGRQLVIKKTDASLTNIITIAADGSDTIDGAASTTLNTQYEVLTLVSDGTSAWSILDRDYPRTFVSFSMTIDGSTSAPTRGTVAYENSQYKRVSDDSIEILWNYKQTNVGANGSGNYLFTLPNGLSVDTGKLTVDTNGFNSTCGFADIYDGTNTIIGANVKAYNSTQFAIYTTGGFFGSTFAAFGNLNLQVSFRAFVPIDGWS